MKTDFYRNTNGFTLIELIVALAVGLVVITAIYMTFTSQQDSYLVQTQVSATQQNLRGAMHKMTQDIQMAGYYTNFVADAFSMNWDYLVDADEESIRPVIYGGDNVNVSGIQPNTDILVVVQADRSVSRLLAATEDISAGDPATIPGSLRNITTDTGDELKDGYYALLVKQNLNKAEIFRVSGPEGTDFNVSLKEDYVENDMIFKVDILCYFIDNSLGLRQKNLSTGYNQIIAENIENLQIRYRLDDGGFVSVLPEGNVARVRAVEVSLLGRTDKMIKGYRDHKTYTMAGEICDPTEKNYQRRLLTTTILTRNIGL